MSQSWNEVLEQDILMATSLINYTSFFFYLLCIWPDKRAKEEQNEIKWIQKNPRAHTMNKKNRSMMGDRCFGWNWTQWFWEHNVSVCVNT